MTGRGHRRARTPPTLVWSNTGGNNGYQDQKRYKPQFYTTLSYYKDGWKGSHDLQFGFDWKRDRRSLFNDQPFDILVSRQHQRRSRRSTSTTPPSPASTTSSTARVG